MKCGSGMSGTPQAQLAQNGSYVIEETIRLEST
jgi:hypothetical protein